MRSLLAIPALLALFASTGVGCADDHDHDEEQLSNEWNETYDLGQNPCSGYVVPDQGPFLGRVALTFDDGPNLDTTPQVLDILAAQGIKATFLINGKRVTSDAHRAVLQRMLDEGHIVGNHTQSHKNATKISIDEFSRQVEATDEIIRDLGIEPEYFRFPYGASNCDTANVVEGFGYRNTGWHVDSGDWCYASSTGGTGHCAKSTFKHVPDQYRDDMAAYTMSQVNRAGGGIVLFHDIHAFTANSLEGIIQQLQAGGYTFVNIDDETVFPLLNGADPGPGVGDACTEAGECTHPLTTECFTNGTELGVCTLDCAGYCDGGDQTFCATVADGVGKCVQKAYEGNEWCAAIPGTKAYEVPRHVGNSGVPAANASVCLPEIQSQ